MSTIKQILLYLTGIGMVYFGIFNQKFPLLVVVDYAAFGILIFWWILLPMLKNYNFGKCLRSAEYFRKFRILKLLLFTYLVWLGIVGIQINTADHGLIVLFWVFKIVVAIFVELILVMFILIDDAINSLE